MLTETILNALFGSPFGSISFLWAPFLVFVIAWGLMIEEPLVVKIFSPLLLTLATFWTCLGLTLAWIWRDGLGPDSIETHGSEAVARFTEGLGPFLLSCGVLFALGLLPWAISHLIHQWRKSAQATRTADKAAHKTPTGGGLSKKMKPRLSE